MDKLFIVPNNDGEALEIQKLLKNNGCTFLITHQQWGASWDKLEDEIKEHIHVFDGIVYGIELQGTPYDTKCKNIDHHKYDGDDRTNVLSSLEQVAKIIDVELTYFQKAISDRDKGHIQLMQEHGFSEDIVQLVGQLDRKAQGITEEQELQSLEICRQVFDIAKDNIINNLVVTLPHGKCQTVRDILYNNYSNILIFSPENEFNYYGKGEICILLHEKFGGWLSSDAKNLGHGFAGGYANKADVINFLSSINQKIDLEV